MLRGCKLQQEAMTRGFFALHVTSIFFFFFQSDRLYGRHASVELKVPEIINTVTVKSASSRKTVKSHSN